MIQLVTRQLTDKQAAFVRHMSETGDATLSVTLSGYQASQPHTAAYELLRTPHVLAALQTEVRRKLVASAPMALGVVIALARNESISPKVRLDAAKILLERAGHVAPKPVTPRDAAETPLHEMTSDELRALASRLEDEIAGRAKDISSAVTEPEAPQAIDVVG